ncbi:MAG: metallophosphoesterase family protein [Anaerolineales bacterium]
MKLAVFSDVHGNPYALRAVLQAIRARGRYDALIVAGDLCMGGSDPAACVDLIQESGALAVYGNTEEYLRAPDQPPPDLHHSARWQFLSSAAHWTNAHLRPEQRQWLADLPFSLRFSPTADERDTLRVVHGNPKDNVLMLYPAPEGQTALWGEIRQPDEHPDLIDALHPLPEGSTLTFGHFHYTHERMWRGVRLINVACCSLPMIDHDPRARFTEFEWRSGTWQVTRHWVEYNWQQEIAALTASDLPQVENFIQMFPK